MNQHHSATSQYRPIFTLGFLYPTYWLLWLQFFLVGLLAFIHPCWRDPPIGACGRMIGRFSSCSRKRAQINLQHCFPHWNEVRREQVIDQMFATAAQVVVAIAELGVRSRRYLCSRVHIIGQEHLEHAQKSGRQVIFMVPHCWGVDFAAVSMAAIYGVPLVAMFKPHRNPLTNWVWNRFRLRFGGRLHSRQQGLKPFIHSVRSGYMGYYLPDQDHGASKSQLVDFFATYKATLPILGKLSNLCQATVLPLFPVYNAARGLFELHLHAAMEGLSHATPAAAARQMNQIIETMVTPYPEQYMWILKLLKTRKPEDPGLYH